MPEPENIKAFNKNVAAILQILYESHPVPIEIAWPRVAAWPKDGESDEFDREAIFFAANWLLAEGYMRGGMTSADFYGTLTSAGFAILGQPSSLEEAEGKTWYEVLLPSIAAKTGEAMAGYAIPRIAAAFVRNLA